MSCNRSLSFVKFAHTLCLALVLSGAAFFSFQAAAADMPLAAASPLAGFQFDDRPLLLPTQRNFQMAMLTTASELGRSCGKMESYGWRMKQSEQQRVNQVFNNTVDRLRGLGYSVEAQTPTSVSQDVTIFTADRQDRHFIFMWSAGEIGLVMVLCESSQPLSGRTVATTHTRSVQSFPQSNDVLESSLQPAEARTHRAWVAKFSPIGDWVGGYSCAQGYTGGTLRIASLNGENFSGYFRFYPTPKNPYVPSGRYQVFGQYDRESHRILINPGKWLERPKGYENTILVGSFDPVARTFSAYFQGIVGCTSFEAKYAAEDYSGMPGKSVHKTRKKKKTKKKTLKKMAAPVTQLENKEAAPAQAAPIPVVTPAPEQSAAPAPAPVTPPPAAMMPGPVMAPAIGTSTAAPVVAPTPTASPAPAATPPVTPAVAQPPAPTPTDGSSSSIMLPAPSNAPASSPASSPPISTPTLTPAPVGTTAPQKSGDAGSQLVKKIVLADSGQWFVPTVPQASPASHFSPTVPSAPSAPVLSQAPQHPPVSYSVPLAPRISPAAQLPTVPVYSATVPEVPQEQNLPLATQLPPAQRYDPTVPPLPPGQKVPDYRPPYP